MFACFLISFLFWGIVCDFPCARNSSFNCVNGNCIHPDKRCDYRVHCSKDNSDTSDEDGCDYHMKNFTCGLEYYSCKSDRFECYKRSARCDLVADCSDRSDEIDCENDNCMHDQFLCLNTGICIDRLWVCDGQNDCGDYSDEHFCVDGNTCFVGYFTCNNNQCVNTSFVCDGEDDCHDNSDENLPDCQPPSCKSNGFLCENSSKCILREWMCDDHYDCSDGLDEIDCTHQTCHGYQCFNGPCISNKKVCDGIADCPNGRDDEVSCNFTCKPGYHRCGESFQCYQISGIRHGKRKCKDGSDEFFYPDNPCSIDNGGCSQICTYVKGHVNCLCQVGYRKNNNLSSLCEDINECDEMFGICSQKCINTVGSYHCDCSPEYPLDINRHCRSGTAGDILFFTNNSVGLMTDKNERSTFKLIEDVVVSLASNISVGSGHSFDFSENVIYWTDSSHTTIYRMHIDQPNTIQVIKTNLENVFDIAVDWIGRNMYWSNTQANSIHVSDLHGNNNVVLLNNLHSPMALVVQPNKGGNLLYWSEIGNISCIDMDGYLNSKRLIFSSELVRPETLVVDFDYLYWTDRRFLYSVRNDGKHFLKLIKVNKNVHFTLALFQDYLYWQELYYIVRVNKFTGKEVVRVVSNSSDVITMMSYFHKALQPQDQGKCNIYLCSHLCLLSNHHDYTCACPTNHKLLANNSTCNVSASIQCTDDFCLNGGRCLQLDYPVCSCKEGFSGRRCQEREGLRPRYERNEIVGYRCSPSYCLNGGTCTFHHKPTFTPTCSCPDEYRGPRCSHLVANDNKEGYLRPSHIAIICIVVAIIPWLLYTPLRECILHIRSKVTQHKEEEPRPNNENKLFYLSPYILENIRRMRVSGESIYQPVTQL